MSFSVSDGWKTLQCGTHHWMVQHDDSSPGAFSLKVVACSSSQTQSPGWLPASQPALDTSSGWPDPSSPRCQCSEHVGPHDEDSPSWVKHELFSWTILQAGPGGTGGVLVVISSGGASLLLGPWLKLCPAPG